MSYLFYREIHLLRLMCYYFVLNVIVYYYSSYSLSLSCLGRTGVPCPPLCVLSGVSSLFFYGCAVVWRVVWFGVGVGRARGGGVCVCVCASLISCPEAPI